MGWGYVPFGIPIGIFLSGGTQQVSATGHDTQNAGGSPMTDPWEWYIYLHEWLIFMGSM